MNLELNTGELQPLSNDKFLYKIRPVKTVLITFLVWAFLFFTAPLEVKIDINWMSYALMALGIFSFLIASWLPARSFRSYSITINKLKEIFLIILIIGAIGTLLKFVDSFVIRGVSLGSGSMTNRELQETGSGNIIGIFGSILAPFSYLPLFLIWKYKLKLWLPLKWGTYFLFFSQTLIAFSLGARSLILVSLLFFVLILLFLQKIKLRFRSYILIAIAGIGVVVFMNYIFIQRTKEFLGDSVYDIVLSESAFNYTASSSPEFKRSFRNMSDLEQSISFSYIVTTQYCTHGVLEFSYLYDNLSHPHTKGSVLFSVYYRFLAKVSPVSLKEEKIEDIVPRSGVYTTFFGPLYVDFGWLLIVFMFLFGRIVKIVFETALKGNDWAILMYFYFFIVLMFFPVTNFINGVGGLFTITGLAIFGGLSSFIYNRN